MKKMILLLGLILGICNWGVTAFAEESQVEVQIDTRPNGKLYEGTESLILEVYDLTEWRVTRASDEKSDKEYILNTYPTKEKRLAFVQQEQLPKVTEAPLLLDGEGKVSFSIPRFQNARDAAYLVLSAGETGKYQMLPIVIYLPQIDTVTNQEGQSLLINCKYDELTPTEPTKPITPSEPEPPISDSSEPKKQWPVTPGTPNDGSPDDYISGKEFPSTNELIRNYCILGLLLMFVGFIGLNRKQGGKNYEEQG